MGFEFVEEPELDPAGLVSVWLRRGNQDVRALGYLAAKGRSGHVCDLHLQGVGPNALGVSGLRALAAWVMEWLDVDELRIEGAARTSGANPGRRPGTLVFRRARHVGAAPERAA